MNFIAPDWLYGLFLLPLWLLFILYRELIRRRKLLRLGDESLIQRLMRYVNYKQRYAKHGLWLTAMTLLMISLARPTLGFTTQTQPISTTHITFVIDVSRSMDAQDITPSRLERAIVDALYINQQTPSMSKSIILFAGIPITYMPTTTGIHLVDVFLATISTNSITKQGTGIPQALEQALLQTPSDRASAIILISDGENHIGDLQPVLDKLVERQIPIHALGYGTVEGAPIPIYDMNRQLTGYKTDESGILVQSKSDFEGLIRLSSQTQGVFGDASQADAVPSIIASIQSQATTQQDSVSTRPNEIASLMLFIVAILLLMDIWLPEARKVLS